MENKPKFALIGNGFILPRHINAIQSAGGEIVGRDCGEQYISILTPNYLHFDMVKREAEKGKIVLCEKPLALTSENIKELCGLGEIYTVLQLRYHPLVKEYEVAEKYWSPGFIDQKSDNEIEMDISVYRDENYYRSWKGQKEKSGGILFNLGIHYFDLLLYLFGPYKKAETDFSDDKTAYGTISGDGYSCKWRMSTDAKRDEQRRVFKINGKDYNFSSQDNLSYEDLHVYVYRDLLQGKGITPKDVLEVTELIEKLYEK